MSKWDDLKKGQVGGRWDAWFIDDQIILLFDNSRYDQKQKEVFENWFTSTNAEVDKLQEKARRYDEQFLTDSVVVGEVEYMDLKAKEEKWDILMTMLIRDAKGSFGKRQNIIYAIKNEHKLCTIQNILCPINMDVSPYEIINRIRGVLSK